jgi:hypothetical protein
MINKSVIVVDLDNTVTDSRWRESMIGEAGWDAYHGASAADPPVEPVIELIKMFYNAGYQIIAVTGRTARHETITTQWLIRYEVPVGKILMRPDDDYRPASIMKGVLLEAELGEDWAEQVLLALEDNESIAEMFTTAGVTVLRPVLAALDIAEVKDDQT